MFVFVPSLSLSSARCDRVSRPIWTAFRLPLRDGRSRPYWGSWSCLVRRRVWRQRTHAALCLLCTSLSAPQMVSQVYLYKTHFIRQVQTQCYYIIKPYKIKPYKISRYYIVKRSNADHYRPIHTTKTHDPGSADQLEICLLRADHVSTVNRFSPETYSLISELIN